MNHVIDAAAMNFSWIEAGRIAGCRGPKTQSDLHFLSLEGIRALVRLAYEEESGISSAHVVTSGLEDFYDPVDDFTVPSQDLIDRAIGFIGNALRSGKPVAVSCGAGYGRTGTILACYFVSTGSSAADAIQQLLHIRPCSREILRVPGQREAVYEFERRKHTGS